MIFNTGTQVDLTIRELKKVLASDQVVLEYEQLREVATTTFATKQEIKAVIYPQSVEQLKEVLWIANQNKTAVYPVSKGKNWGYGSRVPYEDNSIVVALERMNRIVDFDETLGCVTVEPGVSFVQLRQFLKQNKSNFLIDAPGSTLEASVMGHSLERGFAQGQYGSSCKAIASLEVLLPNGSLIHTGMAAFPSASVGRLHAQGVGPEFTSLFLQSNLGVVTKMTIQLARKPKFRTQLFFQLEQNKLAETIDVLRELHFNEILPITASLYNQQRIISTQSSTPTLPYTNAASDSQWYGTTAVHGMTMQIMLGKQYAVEEVFKELSIAMHPGEFNGPNPHYGWNSAKSLHLAYAQKEDGIVGNHPDRDRCGLIWCAPIVPLVGNHIELCTDTAKKILSKHQMTPYFSIHKIGARVAYCTIALIYDRETLGADEKAMACHLELLESLNAAGYYPYRLSQASIDSTAKPEQSHLDLLAAIKKIVDPNQILAKGRYDWGGGVNKTNEV